MAGSLKVLYSQWRTRKHIAATEKEQAEIRSHGQAYRLEQARDRSQIEVVPFGIRALKNGIEVEGVWISHPNTPKSSKQSSATSSLEDAGRIRSTPDIGVKPMDKLTRLDSIKSTTSVQAVGQTLARDEELRRGRSSACDYSRSEYVPYMLRIPEPQLALKELDAVYRTPRWFREDSQTRSTTDSTAENTTTTASDDSPDDQDIAASPTAPAVPDRSPKREKTPKPRHRSLDFSLLDKHRRAQAAETGQFTARTSKRLGTTTSSTPQSQARAQSLSRIVSNVMGPASVEPVHVRRPSPPEVASFADFVQSTPPSPTYAISPCENQDSNNALEHAISSDPPSPLQPVESVRESTIISGPFELEDTSPRRQSFEKVKSPRDNVVRGYGSGFEILKPGSLRDKDNHAVDSRRQQSAPPVSLQNYARPRAESLSRGRKLQKKRRPSMDSQASTRSASTSRGRFNLAQLWSRNDDGQ